VVEGRKIESYLKRFKAGNSDILKWLFAPMIRFQIFNLSKAFADG